MHIEDIHYVSIAHTVNISHSTQNYINNCDEVSTEGSLLLVIHNHPSN